MKIDLFALMPSERVRDRNENKDNPNDWDCCYLCHSPVNPITSTWIEVLDGGQYTIVPESEEIDREDRGYMGCFPVGPTCARKIKAKEKNHD